MEVPHDLLPPVGQHLVIHIPQLGSPNVRPQSPSELRDVALPIPQLSRTPDHPAAFDPPLRGTRRPAAGRPLVLPVQPRRVLGTGSEKALMRH